MERKEAEELDQKRAKLHDEASRTDEELKRTAQIIDTLEELVKDLKNQKEQISTQTQKAANAAEEADEKFKSMDKEVEKAASDKTAAKAKGYTELKPVLKKAIWQLDNKKQEHQKLEYSIEKLTNEAQRRVTELTEKKQELESHMAELQNQMEEMKKWVIIGTSVTQCVCVFKQQNVMSCTNQSFDQREDLTDLLKRNVET